MISTESLSRIFLPIFRGMLCKESCLRKICRYRRILSGKGCHSFLTKNKTPWAIYDEKLTDRTRRAPASVCFFRYSLVNMGERLKKYKKYVGHHTKRLFCSRMQQLRMLFVYSQIFNISAISEKLINKSS